MSSVADRLHKWAVQELNLVSEGNLRRIPDPSNLCHLTKGSNKEIWLYVISHVRSSTTVKKVRRTLLLKRLLKEREECSVLSFNERVSNPDSLPQSISKADEKRIFLENSISEIQSRILNIEDNIRNIKGNVSKINQNYALLELLFQQYRKKCESSKIILNNLVAHLNKLNGNRNVVLGDFLLNSPLNIRENSLKFRQLVMHTLEHSDKEGEILTAVNKSLMNEISEIRENITPIHFIILLKEECNASLDTCTTQVFQKDLTEDKKGNSSFHKLVSQLKYNHVLNALAAKGASNTLHKLLIEKEKFLCGELKCSKSCSNDPDFLIKCVLFEKLADQIGYAASNKYLEQYIKDEKNKCEILLKRNKEEQQQCQDMYILAESFYKKLEMANWLLNTTFVTFQHIRDDVSMLCSFAQNEIFPFVTFPLKEDTKRIEEYLKYEQKLMWVYSEKTDLVKPFIIEPVTTKHNLPEMVLKSLCLYPFQNISLLCSKWANLKREQCANMNGKEHTCENEDLPDISKKYATMLKMLQSMKQSLYKSSQYISDGNASSGRTKVLLEEWFEQKAQFIPDIEYEGKSLKMWIDILSVLSDISQVIPVSET